MLREDLRRHHGKIVSPLRGSIGRKSHGADRWHRNHHTDSLSKHAMVYCILSLRLWLLIRYKEWAAGSGVRRWVPTSGITAKLMAKDECADLGNNGTPVMRLARNDRMNPDAGKRFWASGAVVLVALVWAIGRVAASAGEEVELLILRDAAERGDVDALVDYGDRLATGRGTTPDVRAALEWWARAALNGHVGAMVRVADRVAVGDGVPADPPKAFELWRRAAERGHAGAMARLARATETGLGVETNLAAAVAWWKRAAEAGDLEAQYEWGRRLDEGIGVAASPGDAKAWYERAARQGVAPAMTALARLYAEGRAGPPDLLEAYVWCLLADRLGHPIARRNCEILAAALSPLERFRAARRAAARARMWSLP